MRTVVRQIESVVLRVVISTTTRVCTAESTREWRRRKGFKKHLKKSGGRSLPYKKQENFNTGKIGLTEFTNLKSLSFSEDTCRYLYISVYTLICVCAHVGVCRLWAHGRPAACLLICDRHPHHDTSNQQQGDWLPGSSRGFASDSVTLSPGRRRSSRQHAADVEMCQSSTCQLCTAVGPTAREEFEFKVCAKFPTYKTKSVTSHVLLQKDK